MAASPAPLTHVSFERPPTAPRLASYRPSSTTPATSTHHSRASSSTRLHEQGWTPAPPKQLQLETQLDSKAAAAASYRAWRKGSLDIVSSKKNSRARTKSGNGNGKSQGRATAFVVGAPSSGSGDEGDAENGTTGRSDPYSEDDSVQASDGRELGLEDIIRWQVRQPVYTVDSQDLDSLLTLGIGDYSFVLDSRRPQPPSPSPSPSPATPSPASTAAPPAAPPRPNRISLGKGKFSEVLLVRKGDIEYALKHTQLHPHHPLIATRLLREPTILAQLLPHPNLVKVFETIRTPGHFYLVEENLRESVTLESLVAGSPGGVLPPELAWSILEQLASVVRSLHEPLRVCHRDIKPENILVRVTPSTDDPKSPPTLLLKLLDFGLATHYSASEPKLTTCCGSPAYHSPELWRSLREPSGTVKYWGPEVDIWCLGLTLLRCLTPNKYPLGISHSSIFALSDKVVDALLTVQDERLRRTLAGLMQMDGEKRMKAFDTYCAGLGQARGTAGAGGDDARRATEVKEFKSTTFLPTGRRHTLDLPLLSIPRRNGHQPSASGTVTPVSRSPSRSRPRQRTYSSPYDLPHAPGLSGLPGETSPPRSGLSSAHHSPEHSPSLSFGGSTSTLADSLPSTPRPFSRERATLPAPIELILLNPTDEPIRRSASYIKYALRCAGILYHVRDADSDSAFSVFSPVDGTDCSSSAAEQEANFICHLQCVVKLPVDASHTASKASSALIAALRPPLSRAHTTGPTGAGPRSSSTPPPGSKAGGPTKKKEEIRALTFFLSIRQAPPGSPRNELTTLTRRNGESISRAPKYNGAGGGGNNATTTSKRKHHHQTSGSGSGSGGGGGDRVVVSLSDVRALPIVREALRTDSRDPTGMTPVLPSMPLVEEKRGRAAAEAVAAAGRDESGSRDARNRRTRSRTGTGGRDESVARATASAVGLGENRPAPTPGAVLEERKPTGGAPGGGGGGGFFDFAFGKLAGIGGRRVSGSLAVGGREDETPSTPMTPEEDERSRAMAAAHF